MAFCVATCGTTSACAENTEHRIGCGRCTWNYLRVRGEYLRLQDMCVGLRELPPRARRIRRVERRHGWEIGTTSACAENTLKHTSPVFLQWNYLRVRGEYCHSR